MATYDMQVTIRVRWPILCLALFRVGLGAVARRICVVVEL